MNMFISVKVHAEVQLRGGQAKDEVLISVKTDATQTTYHVIAFLYLNRDFIEHLFLCIQQYINVLLEYSVLFLWRSQAKKKPLRP